MFVSIRISLSFDRYNDLYRDLHSRHMSESDVRLILINEQQAEQYLPGTYYGKIRLYQDNWRDRVIDKLGHHGQRLNNLIFNRLFSIVHYSMMNIARYFSMYI
jgi:hypothetical protein